MGAKKKVPSVYTDVTRVNFCFVAIYTEDGPGNEPGYFLSVKGVRPRVL